MAAQQIQCFTTEKQMDDALKLVLAELNKSDISDISDIDEVLIYNNNGHKTEFRVFVDFSIYMFSVKIKNVEILDSDWDILPEDSAVFKSRVKKLVDITNETNKEILMQGVDIQKDQLQYLLS